MTVMLALVPDAFGGRGGIAQYNRDFLTAASTAPGIEQVEILPRHAPDAFTLPPGLRQVAPGEGRIGYILRALSMALSGKIGVIFCGHINLVPLAALAARLSRSKLVVQTHGIEAWGDPGKPYRSALESADLVLCVSRYTRAQVLSWAAIDPERVVVVPNTVGPMFTPGDASALRTAWGLTGKRVLLTVARMDARERYKGHERVIASLSSLPGDVVYVVLGEGNDMARIEAFARDTGVADRVLFKGGVTRDILIEAYRMADLYVMPSTGEGFGIAFLEAMASGTPALGLAVAGATDALCDGALGIAASEEDFAAALARQLADGKPDPQALSAAVAARFGNETFTACTRGTLKRLLQG